MKCKFCPNDLDNSDEHIILNCLNGKLHSREIICSECNNHFGSQLDNVAKTFFNPVLLVLDFKNASSLIAENLNGEDDYLFKNGAKIVQRKPRMIERKINGKTLLSIIGDKKNALKYFEKYSKRLEERGGRKLATKIEEITNNQPLRIKVEFKTNPSIDLLLNKIAVEYCAYHQINSQSLSSLALRIKGLDESLENVFYCNLKEEVREFLSGEITHFIKLWSKNGEIFVYIELFNILCAVVVIANDYEGEDFDFQYYQDCVSGEKLDKNIGINFKEIEKIILQKREAVDCADMVNKLFYRKRKKDFRKTFDLGINEIKERLEKKLTNGEITDKEFGDNFLEESISFSARLSVDNPYLLDDVDDANNDELNYIHSNLRTNQFDEFCRKHEQLIGKQVKIEDKKNYIVEKFEKIPIAKQNGIEIINVRVVLYDGINRKYMPYKHFFDELIFTSIS